MSDSDIEMGDSTFLPNEIDVLRAQIKEMKKRMANAQERYRQVRKQLLEENIQHVVVSEFTDAIKDPSRVNPEQLEGLQKEIFEKMMNAASTCIVQELQSYHRLAGRTTFDFKQLYKGVRLDTFYNRTYHEPYYVVFKKGDASTVFRHNIPVFIPIQVLERQFLPDNSDTFFRVIHDLVQAYVARREMINEIKRLSDTHHIEVVFENISKTQIEIKAETQETNEVEILLLFKDKASSYPTDVKIKHFGNEQEMDETHAEYFRGLETNILQNELVDAIKEFLPPLSVEDLAGSPISSINNNGSNRSVSVASDSYMLI